MIAAVDLVGSWTLLQWRITGQGKAVSYPYGPDAVGLLIYSPDGTMSTSIQLAHRVGLDGAPRRASETRRAAAFDGFFSYAGTWRVSGHDVLHRVELCLNPDFTGTEQRRRASLAEDVLTLRALEAIGEKHREHELTWRRRRD
jgi:hypothetical protein